MPKAPRVIPAGQRSSTLGDALRSTPPFPPRQEESPKHAFDGEEEFGPYRRHAALRYIPFKDKVLAVIGGRRLAILTQLTHGECSVSVLSQRLGRPVKIISRELVVLQTYGLVVWARRKNEHIYRLTPSLKILREGNKVEFVVTPSDPEPVWAVFHVEEGRAGLGPEIKPPERFLHPEIECHCGRKTPTAPDIGAPSRYESAAAEQSSSRSRRNESGSRRGRHSSA